MVICSSSGAQITRKSSVHSNYRVTVQLYCHDKVRGIAQCHATHTYTHTLCHIISKKMCISFISVVKTDSVVNERPALL